MNSDRWNFEKSQSENENPRMPNLKKRKMRKSKNEKYSKLQDWNVKRQNQSLKFKIGKSDTSTTRNQNGKMIIQRI